MKLCRQRVATLLKEIGAKEGAVYVKGGIQNFRYNTDVENDFRQESNFYYLSGVEEPDFSLLFCIETLKSYLFAPNVKPEDIVWHGKPKDLNELKKLFDFDEVCYERETMKELRKLNPPVVYVLETSAIEWKQDDSLLRDALNESRVIKQAHEIELLKKVAKISSDAHVELMRKVRVGMNERELHALFLYETYKNGCRHQAYGSIVGAGRNAAILHYGANTKEITLQDEFVLVDAGAEFKCYASDITRTFPVSGKFSEDGRILYQIVLNAQSAAIEMLKPGIQWEDVHRTATKVIAQGLLRAGILKGELDEILAKHIPAIFFPHGLGHMMGLDVHDVGGYPKGVERMSEPAMKFLRMRRELKPGMVVTVEPGVYFIDELLEKAKESPFINFDVVARFKRLGGVRIEDDVLITQDGYEVLTNAPRTIQDIEHTMAK